MDVIQAVLANDIDHTRVAALGVVDVGQAVAQPRAQVQQGRRRALGHAVVAIRRSGDDTLEQPEYASHAGCTVERRDKVHLRCSRVGKADIYVAREQRVDHRFRTVH